MRLRQLPASFGTPARIMEIIRRIIRLLATDGSCIDTGTDGKGITGGNKYRLLYGSVQSMTA